MDIQSTRTASETGTGRQFDTTQRHLITAVVDKTEVYSCLDLSFCSYFKVFGCIFSFLGGIDWYSFLSGLCENQLVKY